MAEALGLSAGSGGAEDNFSMLGGAGLLDTSGSSGALAGLSSSRGGRRGMEVDEGDQHDGVVVPGTVRSAGRRTGPPATGMELDEEDHADDVDSVDFDDVYDEGDYEVFDPFAGAWSSTSVDGAGGGITEKLAAAMQGVRMEKDKDLVASAQAGVGSAAPRPPSDSAGLKKLKQEVYDTLHGGEDADDSGVVVRREMGASGRRVSGVRGAQTAAVAGAATQTSGSGLAMESSLHEPPLTERAVIRALRKLGVVLLPEAAPMRETFGRQFAQVQELESLLPVDKAPRVAGSRLQQIATADSDAAFTVHFLMALSEVLCQACFDELHHAIEVVDGAIAYDGALPVGGEDSTTVLILPSLITETGYERVILGVARELGSAEDGEARVRKLVEASKAAAGFSLGQLRTLVGGMVSGGDRAGPPAAGGGAPPLVNLVPSTELVAALGDGAESGRERWRLTAHEEQRLEKFVAEVLLMWSG